MGDLQLFEDAIAEIAARLDLREPNSRGGRETLAAEVSQHYDVERTAAAVRGGHRLGDRRRQDLHPRRRDGALRDRLRRSRLRHRHAGSDNP